MDIAAINEQLTAHEPEEMVLRRISEYGNTLTLAFLCHGGPMEHLEFVVTFENAAVFHLPRILHNTTVRFKRSSPERIKELIPAVSYDESEHNPKGTSSLSSPTSRKSRTDTTSWQTASLGSGSH